MTKAEQLAIGIAKLEGWWIEGLSGVEVCIVCKRRYIEIEAHATACPRCDHVPDGYVKWMYTDTLSTT